MSHCRIVLLPKCLLPKWRTAEMKHCRNVMEPLVTRLKIPRPENFPSPRPDPSGRVGRRSRGLGEVGEKILNFTLQSGRGTWNTLRLDSSVTMNWKYWTNCELNRTDTELNWTLNGAPVQFSSVHATLNEIQVQFSSEFFVQVKSF